MTNKFKKMCSLYKIFASSWDCDFSDEAMIYAFILESTGFGERTGIFNNGLKPNGFIVGKKWLNVTVKMWREDCARGKACRMYVLESLFSDEKFFPHKQWLKSVLGEEILRGFII